MQGRKSMEGQATSDEWSMDTPSKLARSAYSERKEQRISIAQQIANIQAQTFKLQRNLQKEKNDSVKMVLTFLITLVIGYIYFSLSERSELKLIRDSIQELQSRDIQWRKQTMHLEKTIAAMQEELQSQQMYISKLQDLITDIYLSELQRPQKSFRFLMKYSNQFPLQFDQSKNFKRNYKETRNNGHRIRKTTNQQVIAYSEQAIGEEDVWHFQVKIEETELGMIAIGVFTESKNKTCGFCQSDKMYYIYCKNGKIYHGENFEYIKYSVESHFKSINRGDVVTVFVNNEEKELIWYVNNKFAGMQYLEAADQGERLHPFVLITSRGDEIAIQSKPASFSQ